MKLGDLAVSVGGGGVVNPTDIPRNLQFVYGGTNPVEFGGGSAAYALVYAPNATIKISGGGDWYGAALGKILNNTEGSAIHYDRSLRNNFFIPGPYRPISYSISRY